MKKETINRKHTRLRYYAEIKYYLQKCAVVLLAITLLLLLLKSEI
jgi:hypothetical protein